MLSNIFLWISSKSSLLISFSDRSLLTSIVLFICANSSPISAYRCPISLYRSSNCDMSICNEGTECDDETLLCAKLSVLGLTLDKLDGTLRRFDVDDGSICSSLLSFDFFDSGESIDEDPSFINVCFGICGLFRLLFEVAS